MLEHSDGGSAVGSLQASHVSNLTWKAFVLFICLKQWHKLIVRISGGICCCAILGDLFSLFLQKRVLTVHTLLLFFAKLFRSQKSQTIQRKPLLPFLMARVRTYEKSLRMFLPKLFPPVMQAGKMVNAAVWWHPKPTCCQVNWHFSALTLTFIDLLTCLPSFLPISSFWWYLLNDFFNRI